MNSSPGPVGSSRQGWPALADAAVGVGADVLRLDRLVPEQLDLAGPFVRGTFTEREIGEAASRERRAAYLAGRFCGKEAVFKALVAEPEVHRLGDIEITSGPSGEPEVELHGPLKEHASRRGIATVLLSLTGETGCVVAFALACGASSPAVIAAASGLDP